MSIFDVSLYEPIHAGVTADSIAVTADSTFWTADGGPVEGASDVLNAIVVALGEVVLVEPADATDVLDAEVIAAIVPAYGGARRPLPRLEPVVGYGYGVLSEFEGEARGVVIVAGIGVGGLARLRGEASGTAGVAGRSAAQLVGISAAAIGVRGQAGAATAVLKGLSVASAGAVGTRGSGSGTIMKFRASAIGRHDDDEAAVMTFLLAA